jgi:DNA repair protein RadC
MLWSPEQILPSMYELRNRGIIARVSEIDTVRQFSTKWSLDEVVERLEGSESQA